MALGATQQPNKAFEVGKATGKELAAMGINMNFAPVLEVMNEHGNKAISVRAFGDNPQAVGTFGVAFTHGLRAGDVIPCAKHFPSSCPDWRQNPRLESKASGDLGPEELLPFRRIIAEEGFLDSIMLSSSIWPAENATGDDEFPTRAKHIIGDVLRRQLGYEGVTVCDVTDMPICANDTDKIGDALITALNTGCDMMLIYQDPAIQKRGVEALYEALRTGRISPDDVRRSTATIYRLKEHYVPWKTIITPPNREPFLSIAEQNRTIARRAYGESVTVVRDEMDRLPLSRFMTEKGEVLLLTPVVRPFHKEETTMDPFENFGKAMAKIHPRIVHAAYRSQGLTTTHVELIKRCSAIIFVTVNATQSSRLWQLELASSALQMSYGRPIVNVAACDPHDLLEDQKCMHRISLVVLYAD